MGDAKARILVVDDKRVNRVILERHLQKAGYSNIIHAENGQEALDIIKQELPDLILLDIVMPGIDGFEVCRRVKQNPDTKMLPIVMVTALNDQESKLECINIGADDILNKPVDPAELTARVRSLIHVKNYFDQLQKLNYQLLDSIKKAERIQRALLPKKFPEVEGVVFDAYYKPAEYIGGDCYNVFQLNPNQICLYIADVTGHHFDAAMLTVFIKEVISSYARQVTMQDAAFSPKDCLDILDKAFKKEGFPIEIFITIYLAVYDVPTKTLTYSSAGFAQAPIVYGRETRKLPCPGKLIMGLETEDGFDEMQTTLQDGEAIIFYTDGIIEQLDNSLEHHFGEQRLIDIINNIPENEKQKLISNIIEELENYAGSKEFQDDVAILNMIVT
ncbi:PP2C family protein-serine/threonine phosphatase [Desulfuribacillus alkaliarsenatis]|uniref:Response regulatory domain-containing protein n=1 Tax=Desulfuribacillus alkaliarsenatis TaxID=766136 RepID=A0A1E5FZ77_9FIRM|nr:SpoIIE family protein phosphatase [Desulfuribacillus alkaliarsenatis]OEF95886.1 hypothetical protein BHF68_10870 [Desulfuribacillus alkaliarsenatis]